MADIWLLDSGHSDEEVKLGMNSSLPIRDFLKALS
jgi:hypothetical protein